MLHRSCRPFDPDNIEDGTNIAPSALIWTESCGMTTWKERERLLAILFTAIPRLNAMYVSSSMQCIHHGGSFLVFVICRFCDSSFIPEPFLAQCGSVSSSTTCIVIDIGWSGCRVTPIINGDVAYPTMRTLSRGLLHMVRWLYYKLSQPRGSHDGYRQSPTQPPG
jgi:hypothetical protein